MRLNSVPNVDNGTGVSANGQGEGFEEYLESWLGPTDDPPQGSFDGIADLFFGAGPFRKIDWAGTFRKINQQGRD